MGCACIYPMLCPVDDLMKTNKLGERVQFWHGEELITEKKFYRLIISKVHSTLGGLHRREEIIQQKKVRSV